MGTGKSTVAQELSKKYGMRIVEMDQMIVEREGRSIANIFEQQGEAYFRDIETAFLRELQTQENQVISCGGGVVLRDENMDTMKKSGSVVLLTAKPETILERVKDDNERPLLKGNKNIAFIREMMEKRRMKYENAADIIIKTDGKSAEEICDEIVARINQ